MRRSRGLWIRPLSDSSEPLCLQPPVEGDLLSGVVLGEVVSVQALELGVVVSASDMAPEEADLVALGIASVAALFGIVGDAELSAGVADSDAVEGITESHGRVLGWGGGEAFPLDPTRGRLGFAGRRTAGAGR